MRLSAPIRRALVFAGLMIGGAALAKLAVKTGTIADPEIGRRATMILLGAFFVATGNDLPKTLAPWAERRCSGARSQAFQRFMGWTWVLMGILYMAAWLILPVATAEPVSLVVLASGILLVLGQAVRLFRMPPKST